MAEKNNFYCNFSNRKSYNNVLCSSDEELTPVVLTDDMKETMKHCGLDTRNGETWTMFHGKKVPVVFAPVKKRCLDTYMKKSFNDQVERFPKYSDNKTSNDLSLDAFIEVANNNNNNDDECGFNPTGTIINEDIAMLTMALNELIN